jgi:DNA-binding beta-propeller fold protein YncE
VARKTQTRSVFALSVVSVLMVVPLISLTSGCARSPASAEAQAAPTFSISYIASWGSKGSDPGQLSQPTDIATDSLGNVYLADAGTLFIDKFTWDGHPLLSFGQPSLKDPQDIAVDSGGAIYLTDSGRGCTFVFFPEGDHAHELRLKTRPSDEDLLGVAVGEDGLIHVLDADAGRVYTYNPNYRLVRNWQPASNVPNARVRARGIAVGPDGFVYLIDPLGNHILKFSTEGQFQSLVEATSDGVARKLSDQFAVGLGYIFAMDADGRKLHVWTLDGRPKLDLDLAPELGQANRSAPSLAISPRKELLVLDRPEARVLRYRLNF